MDRRTELGLPQTVAGTLALLILIVAVGSTLFVDPGGPVDGAPVHVYPVDRSLPMGPPEPKPFDAGALLPQYVAPCLQRAPEQGARAFSLGKNATPQREVPIVSAIVEELRELEFDHPVEAQVLSSQKIEGQLRKENRRSLSPGQLADQTAILRLLGAIPEEESVKHLIEEVVPGRVLGFYIPRSERLVVRSARRLDSAGEVTLAHELTHALTDQVLGLPLPDGRSKPGRADADLAARALVEGDASLMELFFAISALKPEELLEVGGDQADALAEAERLPYFVERSLSFPYVEGLRYVCERWVQGGWDAVNGLYNDPPSSTAEILFSTQGPIARGARVQGMEGPGKGWKRVATMQAGAADILFLLEAPGNDPDRATGDPRASARALRGGVLEAWKRGEQLVLGMSLVNKPGVELCRGMGSWAFRSIGAPGSAVGETTIFGNTTRTIAVTCDDTEVHIAIARTRALAERLLDRG